MVAPASGKVRRGLARDDLFTCVHEQFMTDTAKYADVVLPATMFVEHDDLYQAGGHSHIQLGPKLVEPPGECRSNHEVLQGLAQRLGAKHRGFDMTAREIADATLRASGWPGWDDIAAGRWLDAAPDFATSHFEHGFGHKDGKFHFAPDWAAIGPDHAVMPALPDHMAAIDAADDEHPFRMVTAPARQFLNTTFTETPGSRKREVRPNAMLHPRDAERLGRRRWRAGAPRQCARRGGGDGEAGRGPAGRRRHRRERLAECRFRRAAWASTCWSATTPARRKAARSSTTPRSGCGRRWRRWRAWRRSRGGR